MHNQHDELLEQWERDGIVVIRNLINSADVADVNALIDKLWGDKESIGENVAIDVWIESEYQKRLSLADSPGGARDYPYKLNDLYLNFPEIRDVAFNVDLKRVLKKLLGGTPLLINSLNVEKGTQQLDHADSLFMPSRKRGGMIAAWIALDSVDDTNGPVRYFPGSHKIPSYVFSNGERRALPNEMERWRNYIEAEIDRRKLQEKIFYAKPGDVIIWHENLIHGGTKIVSRQSTRKSTVFHYFKVEDYLNRFWKLRRHTTGGVYYKRAVSVIG